MEEADQDIEMESDSNYIGSALLSELGLQKVTPLIPIGMPGPANINIEELGLRFEKDSSIPENIEAPESTQPSPPENAKLKDYSGLKVEKDINEHEDIVVESDLGCFFTDSDIDFDKPPKTPGGDSKSEEVCDQIDDPLEAEEPKIEIDPLCADEETDPLCTDKPEIKTESGTTSTPLSEKIEYLDDELGWHESEQSFGTQNHERGGVVLRILVPRLEDLDVRNLIKKEACKSSTKRSRGKRNPHNYISRRFFYFKQRRKCDFCRKYFFNDTLLRMHKTSTCSKLWPYACETCGYRYKNKGKLREHVLSKCGTEKVFVCKVCNRSYLYERQLVEHSTPVCKYAGLFRCEICNYVFKSLERLNEHVLSRCDKEKVFKCDTCKKRYVLKSQLIEHLTPICRALRQFKCEHCDLTFKRSKSLNIHNECFHGIGNQILCDKCGEMLIGSKQFRDHINKHLFKKSDFNLFDLEEKSYVCKLCGKSLKSKESLRSHLRNHSNGNIMACNICGKSFRKDSLRAHLRTHVDIAKAFFCTICEKGFNHKRYLDRHMARHSKDKPHRCRDCGKSFSTMDQLKSHSAFHSISNRVCCNICGKQYFLGSSLRRHIQRVHFGKMKKTCSQCGKTFRTFQDVTDHHRYEPNCASIKLVDDVKPNICTDCGTCFETSEAFIYHTGFIISDQPLQCTTCGKCFSRMTCLNSHLLSHPETIFSCDKCQESFGDTLSLALHEAICGITLNDSKVEITLPASDDKSCLCNQCGEHFNNIYDLTCHALTHINYEGLQLDSENSKSKNRDSFEQTGDQKQIIIDVPFKFDSVFGNSLPEDCNIDDDNFPNIIIDLVENIESNPGIIAPLENVPITSNTLIEQCNSIVDNRPNIIKKETLLHSKADGVQKFNCRDCNKPFAHSRSLRRHMARVHSSLHNKTVETPISTYVKPASEVNIYECKTRDIRCKEIKHLMNHGCDFNLNTKHENYEKINTNQKQVSDLTESILENNSLHEISNSEVTSSQQEDIPEKVNRKLLSKPGVNTVQDNCSKKINEPGATPRVPVCEIKGLNHIVCMRCGNAFSEVQHMNSHVCKVQSSQKNKVQGFGLNPTVKSSTMQSDFICHEKPVICGGCGKIFSETRLLKMHTCKVQGIDLEQGPALSLPILVREKKKPICDGCGKSFSEARHLKRHKCKVQTAQLNIYQESGLKQEPPLSPPILVREKKRPICDGCGKSFSEARHLKRHTCKVPSNKNQSIMLQSNSSNHINQSSPLVCELKDGQSLLKVSDAAFSMPLLNLTDDNDQNGVLPIPQKLESSNYLIVVEKIPECHTYQKSFSDLKSVKTHNAKINSKLINNEPLKCDVCGKTFQSRYNLKRHKLVHISEALFKCNVCEKSFKQDNILQSHMVKVHSSLPSSSSFPCVKCGESFADTCGLKAHRCEVNRRYKCDHCGDSFKKCNSLFKHQLVAHGEKSKCSACHLVCLSTDALLEHIRTVHKEIIDDSSALKDFISLLNEKNPLPETGTNIKEESTMGTKRVELKLPLNDRNMLMFEAYESLLLEACPLEPSVSPIKVNGNVSRDSSEEELVKLEYILGS